MDPFALSFFLLCFQGPSPAQTAVKPITLAHIGKADEHMSYGVKSHMQVEVRGQGLETWIPQDIDISYGFNLHILKVNPGGMMDTRFAMPEISETQGETYNSPPKTTVHKTGTLLELTLSPVNEIIKAKDLAPASNTGSGAGKPDDDGGFLIPIAASGSGAARQLDSQLLDFVIEVYRLALNISSLDSSIDFSPKLPLDDVKPGDTWKKTVGYAPQKVKGQKDKNTIKSQRLDYTYTYQGVVESGGKKVLRVTADLDLTTDLNDFFNQINDTNSGETGVKSITLNLKQHLDFDLDPTTCETLHAVSQATGGFSVLLIDDPEQAVHEERFKGGTEMSLLSKS